MRAKDCHYYHKLDVVVLDLFELHDVIVIPKMEIDATRNFSFKKIGTYCFFLLPYIFIDNCSDEKRLVM